MEEVVSFDKQGRLYIPKKFRKRLSSSTVALSEREEGIFMIPLDEDPFTALASLGKKQLQDKSISQLRKEAIDTTYEHTTKKLRRR